jgi:hypothetical protein
MAIQRNVVVVDRVVSFSMQLDGGDPGAVLANVHSRIDGSDEVVARQEVRLPGEAVIARLQAVPPSGQTLYQSLSDALYALIEAQEGGA